MIFGQLSRQHEKGSLRVESFYVLRSLSVFAKYDVVPNVNCLDVVPDNSYRENILFRVFGIKPKSQKTKQVPSRYIYIRDHDLICHPDMAKQLEANLRQYTAKMLDQVEDRCL